ncbi:MAG: T9SS type A sorting domain-containing protein, partial [Candidatus Coatesbacteria bacterium]
YILHQYLRYAYWDGSDWDWESIEIDAGTPSLSIDSYDQVHISYFSADSGLVYTYYDGNDWHDTVLDPAGGKSSLVLGNNGYPHIAYYAGIGYEVHLVYTRWDGSDWEYDLVDYGTPLGYGLAIGLDPDGRPHIVYDDYEHADLKYAYWNGSSWELEIIDEQLTVEEGGFPSIDIDGDGRPHVSYIDDDSSLKHCHREAGDWIFETVDVDCGFYDTSLVLDSNDYPRIAYAKSGNLMYARGLENTPPSSFDLAQPPDGAEVPEPVTLDWEDSTDDDGDTITYDVWYAADPSFDRHDEVNELTDSTYTFPEGVLTDGTTYYWKVRAWDGWDETWSGPDPYWSFTVDNELDIPVTSFSAESARNGIELTWECADPDAGFNLYRSAEATGVHNKLREMINAELITGESPYSYLDSAVESGATYSYWLEALDVGGASETFGPVSCTAGTFVPSSYALYQSRPNPARGTAVIAFDLPEDTEVTLTVYDLSGRKVMTLVNETLPASAHERSVAGLAPGVYVYRLAAGEFAGVRKMVVME